MIAFLSKLKGDKLLQYSKTYTDLVSAYPRHVPTLMLRFRFIDVTDFRGDLQAKLSQVAEAAAAVLAQIDQTALAAHFGRLLDKDDSAAVTNRKEYDTLMESLTEALVRHAQALKDLLPIGRKEKAPASGKPADDAKSVKETTQADDTKATAPLLNQYRDVIKQLTNWQEMTKDKKQLLLLIHLERFEERYGQALKLISSYLAAQDGSLEKDIVELRLSVIDQLGWQHLVELERASVPRRFPPDYTLF